jgi:hypothetical protein
MGLPRRDHRALDAVSIERRHQLLVREAVGRRMPRIVDERHAGGEDMNVRVDFQIIRHAAAYCYDAG